jgi:hypothetical protein
MVRLLNNKKAVGPIGALFLYVMFLFIWFIWLGSFVNEIGDITVTTNNLTGIEAAFFSNLNVVILICMLLGIMAFTYFTGVQQ